MAYTNTITCVSQQQNNTIKAWTNDCSQYVLHNCTRPHKPVRGHWLCPTATVTEVGGRRPSEPIPALHSGHSPQAAVISSCCLGFTAVARVTCVGIPQRTVNTRSNSQLPARLYRHSVCVRERLTVIPNIEYSELAYMEKSKGKRHKEGTAESQWRRKHCVSLHVFQPRAKRQRGQDPTYWHHLCLC